MGHFLKQSSYIFINPKIDTIRTDHENKMEFSFCFIIILTFCVKHMVKCQKSLISRMVILYKTEDIFQFTKAFNKI